MEAGTPASICYVSRLWKRGARMAVIKVSFVGVQRAWFWGRFRYRTAKHQRECFTAPLTSALPSFADPKIWVVNLRDVIFIGVVGGLSLKSCYCRLFIRKTNLFALPHHKRLTLFSWRLLVICNDPRCREPRGPRAKWCPWTAKALLFHREPLKAIISYQWHFECITALKEGWRRHKHCYKPFLLRE